MKVSCDIIDDLLPLYLEGECLEKSSANDFPFVHNFT